LRHLDQERLATNEQPVPQTLRTGNQLDQLRIRVLS